MLGMASLQLSRLAARKLDISNVYVPTVLQQSYFRHRNSLYGYVSNILSPVVGSNQCPKRPALINSLDLPNCTSCDHPPKGMSLFGDAPAQPVRNASSSLFEDESSSTAQKKSSNTGGLFADNDDVAHDTNSSWGSNLAPKKQARSELIKTLLPGDAVPDLYVETFDALVEEGFVQGSGVNKQGVEQLLDGAKLSASDRGKILEITGAGNWEKATFTRGEVNVLLALIGLAQEEEEVSLDSVDERRNCQWQILINDVHASSLLL